jgi:sugar phosphate isomerase/epimerase
MFRIGIQTNVWSDERHRDLPNVLAEIQGAGYEGFEIGAHRFDLSRPDLLFGQAMHYRQSIVALHAHGELHNSQWFTAAVRAHLERVAVVASEVVAPHLTISGKPNDRKSDDELRVAAETLNRIGAIAQQQGVRLCYHNHYWEIADNARELRHFVAHTDPTLVSFALDVGWVHRGGQNIGAIVTELLPRIAYFHVKDYRGDQFTELGKGVVPFNELFDALRDKACWLIVERDEALPHAFESARECREYLRQTFNI